MMHFLTVKPLVWLKAIIDTETVIIFSVLIRKNKSYFSVKHFVPAGCNSMKLFLLPFITVINISNQHLTGFILAAAESQHMKP